MSKEEIIRKGKEITNKVIEILLNIETKVYIITGIIIITININKTGIINVLGILIIGLGLLLRILEKKRKERGENRERKEKTREEETKEALSKRFKENKEKVYEAVKNGEYEKARDYTKENQIIKEVSETWKKKN